MSPSQREIVLGVGGGIAAYKSCDLLRRLRDLNFAVSVVPTPSSLNFVGKATWEALSGREVTASVWESVDQVRHVSIARHAEAIIIAPATADLIARIAMGRADDLLTNVVLASTSPILIVPAMHPAMWFNDATQANVATLRERGYLVMEPETGALTSGDSGKGRFPTTESILEVFQGSLLHEGDLKGRKVLVTAGGTREPIDPVRYIGNKSSGLQGIAIAQEALSRGAEVVLIAANISHEIPEGLRLIEVETAAQMQDALNSEFEGCDILVMAAAVADARPESISNSKIKKSDYSNISLIPNPDLLGTITANKSHQVVVAFAAETEANARDLALEKMTKKRAELIYLNNVSHGEIFGSTQTQGVILDSNGNSQEVTKTSKRELARLLLDSAVSQLNKLG
jgi:phosphopantothenoylcysteine decarboxylase/phosphopantothenate--cysteine ligase